jgi:hypothetical protein
VAQRGGALIKKWGRSSAASTAVSVADAIRALVTPTAPGDCFSSGVITDGNPYGIPDGLIFSMPCRSTGDGNYEICDDFIIDDWLRSKINASVDELVKEKECVGHLIGTPNPVCRITKDDEVGNVTVGGGYVCFTHVFAQSAGPLSAGWLAPCMTPTVTTVAACHAVLSTAVCRTPGSRARTERVASQGCTCPARQSWAGQPSTLFCRASLHLRQPVTLHGGRELGKQPHQGNVA